MRQPQALPLITADIPGVGGVVRQMPEDFVVRELPAYEPAGTGDHVLAVVEKRGLTTQDAARDMARALGVSARDVGTAGLKDRHAVTRQQISLPPPVTPEAVCELDLPGIRVISAARHPHKLKTGHLAGNQFALRIRELDVAPSQAAERARAVLAALTQPPGCPNGYGEQRFGAAGDNAARGRELVSGARSLRSEPPRRRRLLVSAYQSMLFNEYLRRRIEDGLFRRVLPGDILQPAGSRGLFSCEDAQAEQARLERGDVVPTGPMFGPRMRGPAPGSEAGERERAILEADGIDVGTFARVGKLAPGARRPIAIPLAGAEAAAADDALELRFTLPPGAYATVVLREITKTEPA